MEPLLKKNEKTDESTIIGYEISKDLDSFLINIYYYYRYQGLQNILFVGTYVAYSVTNGPAGPKNTEKAFTKEENR